MRMSEKQGEQQHIRVVVVDDHQVVREGLRMMLEILGEGFVLVGEAADGAASICAVAETQPDVVLMDLRMPGMDGLEAIKQIHSQWPQVAIVILTTYNEDEWLIQGLRAGASGYLLKDASSETLFHAIRSAARGETLLQPDVLARLLSHTSPKPKTQPMDPTSHPRPVLHRLRYMIGHNHPRQLQHPMVRSGRQM